MPNLPKRNMTPQERLNIISQQWTTKEIFIIQYMKTRRCRQTCGDCKKKWQDIESEYVHFDGSTMKALFICDNCLTKLKEEVNGKPN